MEFGVWRLEWEQLWREWYGKEESTASDVATADHSRGVRWESWPQAVVGEDSDGGDDDGAAEETMHHVVLQGNLELTML